MKKNRVILILTFSLAFVLSSECQTIEEIVASLDIDTLIYSGSKDNRINLAIANLTNSDGTFTYESSEELNTDIEALLAYMDTDHPEQKSGFSHYRNFFNVFSVYFPDPLVFETVPSFYQTADDVRDALFLPWVDEPYGWVTMMYSFVGGDGGGAGVDRTDRTGFVQLYGLDSHTVFHEFNHTMPGLHDEYTASGGFSNYVPIEGENLTGANVYDEIPWRKWIDPDLPLPTPYEEEYANDIGLFQGNISGYFGSYRPTAKGCYMGAGGFGDNYGQDLCSVCLQRFVCMLYQYVNVIENPTPASQNITVNGNETLTFSADILKPNPNTQKYRWLVNGVLYAEDVESIEVDFGACNDYTVELIVADETEFVRYDEKFKDMYPEPKQSHVWTIDQSAVSQYDLSINTEVTNADCTGTSNGSIVVEPSGGAGSYEFYLDGEIISNSMEDLAAGKYSLVVSDENGCTISNEVEVGQDPILDFKICSSYYAGSWELSPFDLTEDNQEIENTTTIDYLWSNGSTLPVIVVEEGTYDLKVTTGTGCEVTKEITIEEVLSPMSVSASASDATNEAANGSIFIEVFGGIEPYEILWYKFENTDQTFESEENIIASGNIIDQDAIHAFNNSLDDFWADDFDGANYIGFDFGEMTKVEGYSITSRIYQSNSDPKSWIFQSSADGQSWSDIQTIENFTFSERLETVEFTLDEPIVNRFFRLLISENQGDVWVVVQQLEFTSVGYNENTVFRDQKTAHSLSAGSYQYEIKDGNHSCFVGDVEIENVSNSTQPIDIIQNGNYQVQITNPEVDLSYYWASNSDMTEILHVGSSFQPEAPGHFYVQAYENATSTFVSDVKGFAITMPDEPQVVESGGVLEIVDPIGSYEYIWYDQLRGGIEVHSGNTYSPTNDGYYFVATRETLPTIDPIDPATIPGINLWMDVSDIDADSVTDDLMESSNRYSWSLLEGGPWGEFEWFIYLSNYQNGLAVEDRGSVWLKSMDEEINKLRTVILAYEESELSVAETAPFDGLSETIPKHSDASQLFSNSAPATTLDGKTYLNGELVDPLTTANPMDFVLLSVVFSELQTKSVRQTDPEWEGKLGELIIWDVELSEEQIIGVNEFLRKKWLSSAHLESPRVKISFGSDPLDDLDGDGFDESQDCDDNNPYVNVDATEICDGIDNNCDGVVDEGFETTYYVDSDGDGFGDTSITISACEESNWYVSDDTDCDDTNVDVNTDQDEIPYNGLDDDCHATTLDDDLDGDGFMLANDCDDANPEINSDMTEIPYNGVDDDCNATTLDDDLDGDGFILADDCDDTNPEVNSDMIEIPYNGLDDDCDATTLDDDLDSDGFMLADDCDDTNPEINSNMTEIPYNGVDDDCNVETLDDDLDMDGFALVDDCDDTNPNINRDQNEIPNNGVDEDCDGADLVLNAADDFADKIKFFPNPVTSILHLEVVQSTNYMVYLYDLSGSLLLHKTNARELAVDNLPVGVYVLIVNFHSGQADVTTTVIIDR